MGTITLKLTALVVNKSTSKTGPWTVVTVRTDDAGRVREVKCGHVHRMKSGTERCARSAAQGLPLTGSKAVEIRDAGAW